MLRIVCCWVPFSDSPLRDETHRALMMLGGGGPPLWWEVEFVALRRDDPHDYGRTLARVWKESLDAHQALAVVEPDIVIRPDVLDAFLNHPDDYVAYPYALKTHIGPALGCTRFSAAFIAKYPNLMLDAFNTGVGWRQLDVVIMRRLLAQKYGEQPTVLLPPVEHLNAAKALLPEADPTPVMRVPDIEEIGNLA